MSDGLAEAAELVLTTAQEHKRQSEWHRRRARECMERYNRLAALCREYGIRIEHKGGEGDPHGRKAAEAIHART